MSGDTLHDPVTYPNWMWVLGVILALLVVGWVAGCLVRWWRSEDSDVPALLSISEAERRRYLGLVEEIGDRHEGGELDLRDLHLALAGLMRALGTARTGRDLEVATVDEVEALTPTWPQLVAVLRECEQPSFAGDPAGAQERALDLAREAVES